MYLSAGGGTPSLKFVVILLILLTFKTLVAMGETIPLVTNTDYNYC